LAVIEFARNVAGMSEANSTEFDSETPFPVVALVTDWLGEDGSFENRSLLSDKGGTMRLGAQHVEIFKSTLTHKIYGGSTHERHRHRYELNNDLRPKLQDAGLVISGVTAKDNLVEIIEVSEQRHPWFIGVQFHPEFSSTPKKSHPLFISFVEASLSFSGSRIESGKRIKHSNLDRGVHETSGF
jgi:CTP synthase